LKHLITKFTVSININDNFRIKCL